MGIRRFQIMYNSLKRRDPLICFVLYKHGRWNQLTLECVKRAMSVEIGCRI